jgi:hypothetical protein
MRNSTDGVKIGITELTYLLIGILLLLVMATLANGQRAPQTTKASGGVSQIQQPLYTDYRGVRLGMTATEARTKLGEPAMKSDEQDYYVLSPNETAQIVYAGQKVVTISIDYIGGVGAPDFRAVVGEGMLLQRPDGSLFSMIHYPAQQMWVSYNKSAATVPVVTITMQVF